VQAKVEKIVRSFQANFLADVDTPYPNVQNDGPSRLRHASYRVIADPDNRNTLLDADLMPALLSGRQGDSCSVGLISDVEVNRKSSAALTCPVRTGAVLYCVHAPKRGSFAPSASEHSAPTRTMLFRGMAALESSTMKLLRNCVDFAALQQHIADGELPPQLCVRVHRGRKHFQGVTVEFEVPACGTPQVCPPVPLDV
jgi:hypothetical protein